MFFTKFLLIFIRKLNYLYGNYSAALPLCAVDRRRGSASLARPVGGLHMMRGSDLCKKDRKKILKKFDKSVADNIRYPNLNAPEAYAKISAARIAFAFTYKESKCKIYILKFS